MFVLAANLPAATVYLLRACRAFRPDGDGVNTEGGTERNVECRETD